MLVMLGGSVVYSDVRLTTRGRGFASQSWHCLAIYFWDRWPSPGG